MRTEIPERACIVLRGTDVGAFLQSVVTCDVRDLTEKTAAWGVTLTPQGKFQYGFIAFKWQGAVYLECSAGETLMRLGRHLSSYALNRDVRFAIEDAVRVFVDTERSGKRGECRFDRSMVQMVDPRRAQLGARIYTFDGTSPFLTINGSAFEEYECLRIASCVVDFDKDMIFGKTLVQEALMDKLHGVSLKKGCYVGQEVTARTFYRGKPKKKYTSLWLQTGAVTEGDVLLSSTQEESRKEAGFVTSWAQNRAMASMRTSFIQQGATFLTHRGARAIIQLPSWYTTDA